jgi:hypothetical protein
MNFVHHSRATDRKTTASVADMRITSWGYPSYRLSAPATGADAVNRDALFFRTRTPLTEDTTYYLSATGSDTADGLTATTAKATVAGTCALLHTIDPNGHSVTVRISGLITGGVTWDFEDYPVNLVGTNIDTDGFAGSFTVKGGVIIPHGLRFGGLFTNFPGSIYARGKTIKIVVPSPEGVAIGLISKCDFRSATIQYSGEMRYLVTTQVAESDFYGASFVALNNPTITEALFSTANAGVMSLANATLSGEFTVTHALRIGDGIIQGAPASIAPDIAFSPATMRINAKGVARAAGQVQANGTLASITFGVASVTKSGTGIYSIAHTLGNNYTAQATPNATTGKIRVTVNQGSNNLTAYLTDENNAPVDSAFSFFIF